MPPALLRGDSRLVVELRRELEARGVATAEDDTCRGLDVALSHHEHRILVVVLDPTGNEDVRLVSDAMTAATFVESRVRRDLATVPESPAVAATVVPTPPAPQSAPLPPLALPPPALPPPAPPPLLPSPPALSAPPPDAPAVLLPAPLPDPDPELEPPRFGLHVRPGLSFGTDGSAWLDGVVHGCAVLGPTCVGAELRGSLDLGISGNSAKLLTGRAGLDALVTLEFPLTLGATHLAPGLGVGAGWLRSEPRSTAEIPGSEVSVDFGGLRLEGYLRASWRIAPAWALGATIFGVVDPLAHTSDIRDPEAVLAGNPALRVGGGLELTYGAP
ncbi:MAG: hypothetical protein KC731_02680 [Myxococcales bacterium]|nr:hypothetical protein [Myxococcales bacterium]